MPLDLETVFSTCGAEAGLEIWRVENLKLAPLKKNAHGTFYSGDCYILLHTKLEPTKKQNLHFWIGENSSQDEYGGAAIITAQMDAALDDLPVQFRETESNESSTMRSYFNKKGGPGGIQYKSGGVASGFSHTVTNLDAGNRLLRVKGKRKNIMAKEIAFSWDSVTKDDVYLFEIGSDIYRWRGEEANMFEWMQSAILANSIRDNEQQGRGRIYDMKQDDAWPKAIIKELGDAPDSFPASDKTDQEASREKSDAVLFKVSTDSGSMQTTQVWPAGGNSGKCPRSILESDDCYILDNGSQGVIYVWKGRSASRDEKKESMNNAEAFITSNGYSRGTSVEVYPEGSESEMFRQHFNWDV